MLDTNVILDVWLAREPFWRDSASLLARVEKREITACVCPTTVTTLHYLAKKVLGEAKARRLIGQLLDLCEIGTMKDKTIKAALGSDLTDFEDAVLEAVAIESKVDLIATRDLKHFRKSKLKATEPSQI
ncbi:MAG: PIN domain-containing protein [Opitutales bacterium]